jgi:hypothetical protein
LPAIFNVGIVFQVVPLGKDFVVVLEALEVLARHKVGRTAIGYVSARRKSGSDRGEEAATDPAEAESVDKGNALEKTVETSVEHESAVFWRIWGRIQFSLQSSKCASSILVGVVGHFARVAIVLSAAGKRFVLVFQ